MRNRRLDAGRHTAWVGAFGGLLLALSAPVIAAQSRTPGVERRSDDPRSQAIALLQSADARQQAWGAWLSARNVLPEMIPLLQQVVSTRITSMVMADAAAADQALDALIQLNAEVPPDLLLLVYERRPAQALVLLSKNREDVEDALLTLMRREGGLPWFAAANLALARKLPRSAFVLLEGMQITATLVVSEDGNNGLGPGSGGGSAGCGGIGRAEGLPPWPSFELTSFAASGVVVLAAGPTPIYYQRSVSRAGQTPAFRQVTMRGPSTADRLKYLAALAGFDASTLPLTGYESYPLAWQGPASVDAEVVRIREDVRRRYALLLKALMEARALAVEDANALQPLPVTVILHDGRTRY